MQINNTIWFKTFQGTIVYELWAVDRTILFNGTFADALKALGD